MFQLGFVFSTIKGLSLKEGTGNRGMGMGMGMGMGRGNRERGTGNGERGIFKSGNL